MSLRVCHEISLTYLKWHIFPQWHNIWAPKNVSHRVCLLYIKIKTLTSKEIGKMSICTNTDGSYECECKEGFILSANGTCVDLDECSTG